jgi:histidine ammonia-lyase
VRSVLEVEANSATDNPLVFADEEGPEGEAGLVVSGGNFHGQPVAQVLDVLAIAIADLASISERRTERLVNPDLSGHPAFLTRDPGLRSGFMLAQITAAALVNECKLLAHPASVDSIPTGANREDHVSMGMTSALKARRALRNLETVLGIELLCAAQAIEFLRPLRSSEPLERAHAALREKVPELDEDRVLSPDIEAAGEMVRSGVLAGIGEGSRESRVASRESEDR